MGEPFGNALSAIFCCGGHENKPGDIIMTNAEIVAAFIAGVSAIVSFYAGLAASRSARSAESAQRALIDGCCGALKMLIRALIMLMPLGKISLVPDPRSATCSL